MVDLPRGIRNNNPGNIIRTGKDTWQGLSKKQIDPKFCSFDDAIYGIRALARLLIRYQDAHDCSTVKDFITRFAPQTENNTSAYINAVCKYLGVEKGEHIDTHSYKMLRGMCEAIIQHENGKPWKAWYTEAQMVKAMVLAGVEPEKRSLATSKTVVGSSIAATAAIAAPIVQDVQEQIMPFTDYSTWLKYIFVGLTLLGAGLALWAKINERKKGIS